MIQFPSGPGFDPAQAAQGVDRNSLPAARPVAAGSAVPQADTLEWHDPVSAALDLDLLRDWDDGPARATGAAEYQQAVDAVSRGDRGAALHHLEQSVLTHPAYADAAQQDPAFDAVRTEVREMVSRVGLAARMRAETAIGDARSAIESSHAAHATGAAQLAWINLAQAQFDSASHAGYIAAAQAAARAQQLAGQPDAPANPTARVQRRSVTRPRTHAVWRAARDLCLRLPLLAILLAWLLAGIIAGLASLPFREGSIVEMRQTLFPLWALALLGMIVLGFLRSIRRLLSRTRQIHQSRWR